MEEQTCMEYVFDSIQNSRFSNINQDILFNASNEFRNLWNLVKKLRDLARVDVQKITKFLDAVQEAIVKRNWTGASRQCVEAENEYRQIRRYIRPSYLEDFKVLHFIKDDKKDSKSANKREKRSNSFSENHHHRQNFRNQQINKQHIIEQEKETEKENTTKENKTSKDAQENTSNDSNTDKQIIPFLNENDINHGNATNEQEIFQDDTENKSKNVGKVDHKSGSYKETGLDADTVKENNQNGDLNARKPNVSNKTTKIPVSSRQSGENHDTEAKPGRAIQSHNSSQEVRVKSKGLKKETDLKGGKTRKPQTGAKKAPKADLTVNASKPGNTKSSNPKETKSGKTNKSTERKETNDDSNKNIDISSLISERMTEVKQNCKPEEIVFELSNVYEMDWKLAYDGLTGCQPSNGMKNSIDFLSDILKNAVGHVIGFRAREEKALKKMSATAGPLQTLKKTFLTQTLKTLQEQHSIQYARDTDTEHCVNIYSAKCIELAWFMFNRNPPMEFDYSSRPMLLEDLLKIFRPYKSEGHSIQYVVWPAIREFAGGEVISQGIADFR